MKPSTSLYGFSTDILEIEHMLERLEEEGEAYEGAADDMVQFLLAPKEEKLAEKVDAYVQVVRGKEASIKARKKEITHLKNMNKAELNGVKRMKDAVKDVSEQLEQLPTYVLLVVVEQCCAAPTGAVDVVGVVSHGSPPHRQTWSGAPCQR